MGVRRLTQDGNIGYGVRGYEIGNPTEPVIISMRDISTEIPLPVAQPTSPFANYVWQYVYLQWRFTVAIGIADMEYIKQYFNPLGKAQFGRWAVSAFGYITDEGFISYAKQMSAVYTCVVRYVEGDRDDSEPSSEPQSDAYPPGSSVGEWRGYGDGASVVNGVPSKSPADGLALYLPPTIALANIGITYQYRIIGYSQDDIALANFPPVIIF